MDGAWVLTVAKSGRGVVADSPDPVALGFEPSGRSSWTASNGSAAVTVWSGPRRTIEGCLHADEDGATFLTGDLRRAGESWPDHRRWAERLAEAARRSDPGELQVALRGVFAAGHLEADGTGWVMADPFSLRCLYWGEDADHIAIGSRAALVAASLAGSGRRPAKDLDAATWLAFTSYWVGERTGFEGVRTVAPGGWLRIEPGAVTWEANPALDPDAVVAGDRSVDEVVPGLVEDVADSLRAVLERPADRHVIQLTGGKDSRLLLGVALWAGIADRFTYLTAGPPGLPDVQIASELADRFGLRHEVRFFGARPAGSDRDRRRRWVADTGGMLSAWETPGTEPSGDLLVSGVYGEYLRYFHPMPEGPEDALDGRELIGRLRPGRLGLLRPSVEEVRRREFLDAVRPSSQPRGDAFREVRDYYARYRVRFTRTGPRLEVNPDERVLPLYSPVAIAASRAIPNQHRQASLVCVAALQRCAPDLVVHRLAHPDWVPLARERIGPVPPIARPSPSRAPEAHAADVAPSKRSLNAELQAERSDERAELMHEVLADEANPIWDLIDRGAVRLGVEGWADLDLIGRREVFGAISAAIWARS